MYVNACSRQLEVFNPLLGRVSVTQEQRRRVIAGLNGRSQVEAFEAAKLVWKDSDVELECPLIVALKNGRRPFNRSAAAYAMQVVGTTKVVAALERVVNNKSEHQRVRGDAAEALAHNHRRRSHDVLLKNLSDPNKHVRFWCAFALGQMAEQRAIPVLEQLASTDARMIKGFHSVAKEAADALDNIKTELSGHRRRGGCIFCMDRPRRS